MCLPSLPDSLEFVTLLIPGFLPRRPVVAFMAMLLRFSTGRYQKGMVSFHLFAMCFWKGLFKHMQLWNIMEQDPLKHATSTCNFGKFPRIFGFKPFAELVFISFVAWLLLFEGFLCCLCLGCVSRGAVDDFFLTSSSRDMTATVLSNAALEKKKGG